MLTFETADGIVVGLCRIERADGRSRREAETEAVGRIAADLIPGQTIRHRPNGAPYLDSGVRISVSHSRGYAALALSAGSELGIDVESRRPQLRRVAPRVLSSDELSFYGATEDLLLRAWTMKEAAYKAAGTDGLDFARDIRLPVPCRDEGCEINVRGRLFSADIRRIDADTILCITILKK